MTHFNPNHPSLRPKSFADYLDNEKTFVEVQQLNRMRVAINRTEQPALSGPTTDNGQATLSAALVDSTISGQLPKKSGALSDQQTANFEDDQ